MFNIMIKKILIILLLLFIAYLIISYFQKSLNKSKKYRKKSIIHSSSTNRSYFIHGYNDHKISEIQYSLNMRDNIYTIKGNNLFFKNRLFANLQNIC